MNAAQQATQRAVQQALEKRRKNQAAHYNAAQAKAAEQGPMHLVGFWSDVCRKVAKDALAAGDRSVADKLAAHLNDFYRAHSQ